MMAYGQPTVPKQAPNCVGCGEEVDLSAFRDLTSVKEFSVTGGCQACQDKTRK